MPMREQADVLQSAKSAFTAENPSGNSATSLTPVVPRGSKLKTSIEKKIENIWHESQEAGWSYNEFVAHMLEVLIVLNHRIAQPKNAGKGKVVS